jgi:hypothetical protein
VMECVGELIEIFSLLCTMIKKNKGFQKKPILLSHLRGGCR